MHGFLIFKGANHGHSRHCGSLFIAHFLVSFSNLDSCAVQCSIANICKPIHLTKSNFTRLTHLEYLGSSFNRWVAGLSSRFDFTWTYAFLQILFNERTYIQTLNLKNLKINEIFIFLNFPRHQTLSDNSLSR